MESFEGKLAVVTGGGSGMGRQLVLQLLSAGCSVATCDVNPENLAETARLAEADRRDTARLSTHECDVSVEADVLRFRDGVLAEHATDHVHLVFNNAGIGGGGSFLTADRAEWDRTFAVCWGGVYNGCRAFLPLLVASEEGHLINTSSVNGFWAMLSPGIPHTAYSAAKFAVKGLSEALIEDLRIHAPHVKVSVVMPGHIGTDIINNTRRAHAAASLSADTGLSDVRAGMARRGIPVDAMDDETVQSMMQAVSDLFRDRAPTTAAEAATEILDGVRSGRWRILVGDDARRLDAAVRAEPEAAYDGGVMLGPLGL